MDISDVRAVQSVERTATADRHSSGNPPGNVPAKSRQQFSRVFNEEDGVVYRVVDEGGMILTQVPSEEVLRVAKRVQQLLSERKAK